MVSAIWLALRWYRHWTANRYRRTALQRLLEIEDGLRHSDNKFNALATLPVLVKQTTLAFAPREYVANLSGKAWLAFLDSTYAGKAFTEGPGKFLPELSYQPASKIEEIMEEELKSLLSLLKKWIRRHHARV